MQAIHATLKDRHRATHDGLPAGLNLRLHRALSWLQRAAQCDDPDARFIFLWIAFNAAYAQDIPPQQRLSEQDSFRAFLHKLHGLDAHRRLDDLVWHTFSGPIRILLDNPYVFESFWSFQRGEIDATTWQERLAAGKRKAAILLAQGHTPELLALVFQRIYTLRNQLMHGGATWNSTTNRAQVQDCANLMGQIVPVVIDVMLSHPEAVWGAASYPVINDSVRQSTSSPRLPQ